MPQGDPRELLVNIVKILDRLGIPYMVTGGIAVLVWGRPRFTADIDIVFELKEEQVDGLANALRGLGEAGYVDKQMMQEAIENRSEFNFIDGETGVKVDFWVLKDNAFDTLRLKRRVVKNFLGEDVYFISPEDLILSKLQWYQQTQSSRHLEDAESVLKISGERLDMDYLKKQAERLGIYEHYRQIITSLGRSSEKGYTNQSKK